jgi:antitoxin MazE
MKTSIAQWGNSLAVRLPKAALELAGLRAGAELEVIATDGAVTLRPVRDHRKLFMDALRVAAERIPAPDTDAEWDLTERRGDETW